MSIFGQIYVGFDWIGLAITLADPRFTSFARQSSNQRTSHHPPLTMKALSCCFSSSCSPRLACYITIGLFHSIWSPSSWDRLQQLLPTASPTLHHAWLLLESSPANYKVELRQLHRPNLPFFIGCNLSQLLWWWSLVLTYLRLPSSLKAQSSPGIVIFPIISRGDPELDLNLPSSLQSSRNHVIGQSFSNMSIAPFSSQWSLVIAISRISPL